MYNSLLGKNYFMSEYQENMNEIGVFGCLTPCKTFPFNEDSLSFPYFEDYQQQHSLIDHPPLHKILPPTSPCPQPQLKPQSKVGQSVAKPGYLQFQDENQTKQKHDSVQRGEKDDTVQLNINFKTILYNYFKQLVLMRELPQQQHKLVFQFGLRSPSFKSLMLFFGNKYQQTTIRSFALKLIESPQIIKKIMRSRCNLNTKLQMIKFVQILRINIKERNAIIRWKDMLKK